MADKDERKGEEETPAVAEDAAAAHEEIPEESFVPAELVGIRFPSSFYAPSLFPCPC
jgi:hypothetical protein